MTYEYDKKGWQTTIEQDRLTNLPVLRTNGKYQGKIDRLYTSIGIGEAAKTAVISLPQSQEAVIEFSAYPNFGKGTLRVEVKYESVGSDKPEPIVRKSTGENPGGTTLYPGIKTDVESAQELEEVGQTIFAPSFPGYLSTMPQETRRMRQALKDQLNISRAMFGKTFTDAANITSRDFLAYEGNSFLHHTSFSISYINRTAIWEPYEYTLPSFLSNRRMILYFIKENIFSGQGLPEFFYCLQQVITLPEMIRENISRYYRIDGSLEPESKPLTTANLRSFALAS